MMPIENDQQALIAQLLQTYWGARRSLIYESSIDVQSNLKELELDIKSWAKRLGIPFIHWDVQGEPSPLIAEAQRWADHYGMIVTKVDGEYYGTCVELPMVMADGRTPGECCESLQEAVVEAVVTILEQGEEPPAPQRRKP